jgi:hypothetical protein
MVLRDQKSDTPGVVVWVTPRATGRHNDQRARIDGVEFLGELTFPMLSVTMLGDGEHLVISPDNVCGVEIFRDDGSSVAISKRAGGDLGFKVSRS